MGLIPYHKYALFIKEQEKKINNDPEKLMQYKLWFLVNGQVGIIEEKIRETLDWCHYINPENAKAPNLINLLSRWQIVNEYIPLLKIQPFRLTQQQEIVFEICNYNTLREKQGKLNNYLQTIEKLGADKYQSEINTQLLKEVKEFKRVITQPYEEFNDDTNLIGFEACCNRNGLEYALMAISNIQKQKNKDTNKFRFENVDYNHFKKMIEKLDIQFKQLLQKDNQNGLEHIDPIAPKTFWWRH